MNGLTAKTTVVASVRKAFQKALAFLRSNPEASSSLPIGMVPESDPDPLKPSFTKHRFNPIKSLHSVRFSKT